MSKALANCLAVMLLLVAGINLWPIGAFAQDQKVPSERTKTLSDGTRDTAPNAVAVSERRVIVVPSNARPEINSAVNELEIDKRFNQLRSELLDERADSITLWLAVIALVLTFFGIIVAIAGFFGFSRFRQIEAEAKANATVAEDFARQAKLSTEEIVKNRDKSEDIIRTLTANAAAENPENVSELIDSVRSNPDSTLLDNAVADAFSLYSQGKIIESLRKWHAIAELAEEHDKELAARAWLSVGFLVATRDWEYSITANDRAIALNPSLVAAYVNRGAAKHALGRHEDAITDYDEAIRRDPDFANGYSNRGVALGAVGKYREAISDHDKAIELQPEQASFYANRGTAKDELGEYDGAIEDHDKAIELKPNHAEYYSNRGVAKAGAGRHSEAMADHNEAIRLEPRRAGIYNNRGTANLSAGEHEAALADFSKAIELQPNFAKAYNNRGNAYLALSQHDEAIQEYDEALRLNEKYAEAYHNRGEAKVELGQYEGAKDDYDIALGLKPRLGETLLNRAKVHLELQNRGEATKDLHSARQILVTEKKTKLANEAEELLAKVEA